MGVRGLQTYLEQDCPNACYEVHLPTLISDYYYETGCVPEIVVDAQSCHKLWSEGLDWTVGLEVREIIYRLRKFVNAFVNIGAELVFYFGGSTPEKKRSTWLCRRRDRMNEFMHAFDYFYEGRSFEELPSKLKFAPPHFGTVAASILKNILRCQVYKSIDECDEEIIHYVHEHNCFAIFAQDTDFVVSEVDCFVLSANNFDIYEMTTLVYDQVELSYSLNIRVDQLPLLSVLAGNDLFPQKLLKTFHLELCEWTKNRFVPYDILMPAIGSYIRSLPRIPIENLLQCICEDVFDDLSYLEDMRIAYYSYFIQEKSSVPIVTHKWSRILWTASYGVRNFDLPSAILKILSERIYECSCVCEDFRSISDSNPNPCSLPSATITRPLRQRLYGILLFESKYSDSVVEWCGENVWSYQTPVFVEPIFPKAYHPGLLNLWDENETYDLIYLKWMLFLEAVSPTICDMREWSLLESDELVPVAVCYYLLETFYLSEFELDAILAAVALYPSYNRIALQFLPFTGLNFRTCQVTVTFLRTYVTINLLLAACGYPARLPNQKRATVIINFEGRLFNLTYNKAQYGISYEELCDHNSLALQKFYRMRNVIIKNRCVNAQNQRSTFNRRSRRQQRRSCKQNGFFYNDY